MKLIKYTLNFDQAFSFASDSLTEVNTLSNHILETIKSLKGNFFTLLPQNANLQNINKFDQGGVLIQPPEIEYEVAGKKATYSSIPNTTKEMTTHLLDLLKSTNNFICIIDDYNSLPSDFLNSKNNDSYRFYYNNEVYYLIKKEEASEDLLCKCLLKSTTFWHSLCVLTKNHITLDPPLAEKQMQEFAHNASLVTIGAYDGEGYVCWERIE